jgi:hypothetical protein
MIKSFDEQDKLCILSSALYSDVNEATEISQEYSLAD